MRRRSRHRTRPGGPRLFPCRRVPHRRALESSDERRSGRTPRRRRCDGTAGGGERGRHRRRRGEGRDEGRWRGHRRRSRHPAVRDRGEAGARAPDDLADREGLVPEQAPHHRADPAGAQHVPAAGPHAAAHAGRRLSVIRGRAQGVGEAAGQPRGADRGAHSGEGQGSRGHRRARCDHHRFHPQLRDHGHLPQ